MGLPWTKPSPNLRTPTQAFLYPGVGIIETTNVSVGRGTDTPFEIVGAPWIDGSLLWTTLRERQLPGLAFTPVRFTPTSSKHEGKDCGGVRISVTDRAALDPLRLGITLAWALRRCFPSDFETSNLNRLLLEPAGLKALEAGAFPEQVIGAWQDELGGFRVPRARFLHYR